MKLINVDCPNCGCKIHIEPEIIRCEDCKNWYAFADKQFGYCRRECWEDDELYRLKVETVYDDFCSYGKRKEGKENR